MENVSSLPAIMPAYDDGWNDIDANDRVIQGDLLKCVDGVWTVNGTTAPKHVRGHSGQRSPISWLHGDRCLPR
jgi:hypothetical protein